MNIYHQSVPYKMKGLPPMAMKPSEYLDRFIQGRACIGGMPSVTPNSNIRHQG